MANQKIVVDPITRIEGHLRMQAVMDDNNVIVDAMSTGTMWRGLEVILKGRDPRDAWAFVERICGVCTGIHALSAVRAVEDALGIKIPKNANIIRNLMNATLYCQDHLTHFYQLHGLDWIDVVSALNADPKKTSEIQVAISNHALSSPAYFKEIQDRLKKFVASGQLGIFANAYWGNPAYKLPPEVNLLGVTHYLESLDYQRQIVKVHTILGGKNPHPNYLVGGVPCPINMNDTGAQGTMVNQIWVNYIRDIAKDTIKFIEEVYYPDLMAMAPFYKDWFKIGGGLSNQNLLCYGDFPRYANDLSEKSLLMPNGAIIDGKLDEIHPVDLKDPNQIKEFVDHSWYQYPQPDAGLHPWDGITDPKFELGAGTEGTKTDIKWLGAESRYSWIKAPRWNGHAMETGPLARMVLAYAKKMPEQTELVNEALSKAGVPIQAMFSTLGRTLARCLEARMMAREMLRCVDELEANIKAGDEVAANMEKWEPSTWPLECKGVGPAEAPRGALGHWCVIKGGVIANWQAVVPSTWNASPRDPKGQLGAYEAALLGTPVAVANQPLEILRTIHSFDPCLACATHVLSTEGQELCKVQVR
ncbi:nickel-dependent hydrogenase large subunit [Turicimonas muris]|uniref:Uptake hydrogenase large subunit n=7 Tax=Turicimonas muris TaxID=1796652 RepID=A0A227KR15_9BURK|nr:nickel-dependent hydrogenase large subunit [Turicimonas muris]ANU66149.1 hydrogenase 2 large subunit [Burkholderiales bacterium YL45]OXE49803.1 nickel-dependent hydrogenase large subunit [Turicimonas muris]QQQ97296.1 nickel-dependent hydrogenase large subunit [Turicimonas muris]